MSAWTHGPMRQRAHGPKVTWAEAIKPWAQAFKPWAEAFKPWAHAWAQIGAERRPKQTGPAQTGPAQMVPGPNGPVPTGPGPNGPDPGRDQGWAGARAGVNMMSVSLTSRG